MKQNKKGKQASKRDMKIGGGLIEELDVEQGWEGYERGQQEEVEMTKIYNTHYIHV